ncbi:Protein kinase-like domain [Pseudocohnilembus persalinus]|uniref:Protein kinase-like domain n=1 Tax=Pseudocohnilembus persalinus TaxID=266149 RepID=A0A0V0QDD7_PSEPJ|nr:Protein kinase-like domain [Pseudocohnilembus persalinus]|eukprot:KRX00215.1 Protein kinase-like domain [Pseudocohnilembus persalinus]
MAKLNNVDKITQEAQQLLIQMLQLNPTNRINILQILNHNWMIKSQNEINLLKNENLKNFQNNTQNFQKSLTQSFTFKQLQDIKGQKNQYLNSSQQKQQFDAQTYAQQKEYERFLNQLNDSEKAIHDLRQLKISLFILNQELHRIILEFLNQYLAIKNQNHHLLTFFESLDTLQQNVISIQELQQELLLTHSENETKEIIEKLFGNQNTSKNQLQQSTQNLGINYFQLLTKKFSASVKELYKQFEKQFSNLFKQNQMQKYKKQLQFQLEDVYQIYNITCSEINEDNWNTILQEFENDPNPNEPLKYSQQNQQQFINLDTLKEKIIQFIKDDFQIVQLQYQQTQNFNFSQSQLQISQPNINSIFQKNSNISQIYQNSQFL